MTGRARRIVLGLCLGVVAGAGPSAPARAEQPSIEELLHRIDALQHRIDQLESHQATATKRAARKAALDPAPAPETVASAPATRPAAGKAFPPLSAPGAPSVTEAPFTLSNAPIPGLLPPEPMGNQFVTEDALRSDLPGIAIRVPGTDTQVRLYGWAKLSGYADANGRNQTDAPPPTSIPLINSPADRQGGDFGATARFSRVGIDTRSLIDWGTLETRLEGDFGGGASFTTSTATFRLRQAWAEVGTEKFRVLFGQANSLWNEGVFETLIDATNLNQSFVRQAQVRLTGRLATGLTGQVSLEAPETQYTSLNGVVTPSSNVDGGASPAFNAYPDLLGRLTYRYDGLELSGRGLLREISARTAGTALPPPSVSRDTTGWGFAGNVRLPVRWVIPGLAQDEAFGMAYYGDGIGRYFAGNSSGLDAVTNNGLPGALTRFTLDSVPTYGATAAYRHFWTDQLRTTLAYSWARQDFPGYALGFTPGSAAATSLNREMQQVFVNLIWSPFATLRNGVLGNGWLDLGVEYVSTRRDLYGGAGAGGAAGGGHAIANRFLAAAVGRF